MVQFKNQTEQDVFYLPLKQYTLNDVVFFKNGMIDEPRAVRGML